VKANEDFEKFKEVSKNFLHKTKTFKSFFDDFYALQELIFLINEQKGFWQEQENPLVVPTKLALIVSEVSEALEAHRKEGFDGGSHPAGNLGEFSYELADVFIRLLDLAEACGVDLIHAVYDKLSYNLDRKHKHGKNY
tara:strand:+ start:5146 stop:5559 length:414 start_codon:yes stop_codon:yes gene_type:complete